MMAIWANQNWEHDVICNGHILRSPYDIFHDIPKNISSFMLCPVGFFFPPGQHPRLTQSYSLTDPWERLRDMAWKMQVAPRSQRSLPSGNVTSISMGNGPLIDVLPIKMMIFHSYVSLSDGSGQRR
jgi:hypothetical protein